MTRSSLQSPVPRFVVFALMFAMNVVTTPAVAQTNIDAASKWVWGENLGWLNWADAGAGAQGAVIGLDFLSGYVWSERAGWINLGDGSPASGFHYANVNASDFGVNVLVDGSLDGLAWGENLGWVNFATTPFVGAQGARVQGGRLRGFAWSERAGWINLDDANAFVAMSCRTDFNNDGIVNVFDLATLIGSWDGTGGLPDVTGDGVVNVFDLAELVGTWGACP